MIARSVRLDCVRAKHRLCEITSHFTSGSLGLIRYLKTKFKQNKRNGAQSTRMALSRASTIVFGISHLQRQTHSAYNLAVSAMPAHFGRNATPTLVTTTLVLLLLPGRRCGSASGQQQPTLVRLQSAGRVAAMANAVVLQQLLLGRRPKSLDRALGDQLKRLDGGGAAGRVHRACVAQLARVSHHLIDQRTNLVVLLVDERHDVRMGGRHFAGARARRPATARRTGRRYWLRG